MPRKVTTEAHKHLSDKEWLIGRHVNQLISIVEISKELGVTPGTVRKALRTFGVTSPPQQQLREASNIRRYGVRNPGMVSEFRDKALHTMTHKYGGHNWCTGNRDKRDSTCQRLYGDTNVGKTLYARAKAMDTNLSKYGRYHVNQRSVSNEAFEKLSDPVWMRARHHEDQMSISAIAELLNVEWITVITMMTRVGVEQRVYTHKLDVEAHKKLTDVDWMVSQNKELTKSCTEIAGELGVDPWTVQRRFREAGIPIVMHHSSQGEREMVAFIQSLGVDVETNNRTLLAPKELDIYIPKYKVAIEYCGVYWHGELRGKYRSYHKEKYDACKALGIQLLTVYDWEWNNRRHQVEQKIRMLMGMGGNSTYARQCEVCAVATAAKTQFLDQYHIQGSGPGSITYGLTHQGNLVAVMSFIRTGDVYTLNRYASSLRVVGGFSKLLKHFTCNHRWTQIVSFADLRWSKGDLYYQHGFKLSAVIPPDYAYIIGNQPMHKFAFRHASLKTKLERYDPAISEWENMKAHGYDRIWDCGKLRFVMNNDNNERK